MRTTTLLALGAAILVAACSDQSPSPTSPRSVRPTGAVSASSGPSANAKPVDQTGFTKITKVVGPVLDIPHGNLSGTSTATCPDGTTLVGGGHIFVDFAAGASPPWISTSADDGKNGWLIYVYNYEINAGGFAVEAIAYCAS